jgi:hypothetical protein
MDERAGPVLLLSPVLLVVAGYLLAWRAKSPRVRKFGNLISATVLGLVALFGSWWALGMTVGLWALDGSSTGPQKVSEVLIALVAEFFLFLFPAGAWYMCARFARMALNSDQVNSKKQLQE